MKRLILSLLLLSSIASQTYSQDSVRYWITAEQHSKIFQLRDDNRTLSVGIKFLQQENSALRFGNDSLKKSIDAILLRTQMKLDSIKKILYRDSAKISMMDIKLKKSDLIISSKDVAIDKWKSAYYQILKYKKEFTFNTLGQWLEITVSAAILCGAVFLGIRLSQEFELTLTL